MENEIKTKRILVEGYKSINFESDGQKIQMCKVNYSYIGNSDNSFGRQSVYINLPLETVDVLKGHKLPLYADIQYTIEDLTKKPNLVCLKVVDNIK